MDNDLLKVNIIIIGDAAVGKTCLMGRYLILFNSGKIY